MLSNQSSLINEAAYLYKYYTGNQIPDQLALDYARGVDTLGLDLTEKEETILSAIKKNTSLIKLYDFGIVRFMPTTHLRRRLLLINALIECQPNYLHFFLNNQKIKFGFVQLVMLTIKAGFIWMLSFILFTIKGWR